MSSKRIRIRVIEDRCQGHNRCKVIAPTLFELDSLGNSKAAGDGFVPPELVEKARLAVSNCPEFAIELVEE